MVMGTTALFPLPSKPLNDGASVNLASLALLFLDGVLVALAMALVRIT